MTLVVGIDPGSRECGVALYDVQTSAIIRAWLSRSPEKEDTGPAAWEAMARTVAQDLRDALFELGRPRPRLLVIERQWIGSHRAGSEEAAQTRNPSVILGLAYTVGAITFACDADQKLAIQPSTWKGGSTKGRAGKKLVNRVTWASMSPAERAAAPQAERWNGHNVKDSIGIARWGGVKLRAIQLGLFAEG